MGLLMMGQASATGMRPPSVPTVRPSTPTVRPSAPVVRPGFTWQGDPNAWRRAADQESRRNTQGSRTRAQQGRDIKNRIEVEASTTAGQLATDPMGLYQVQGSTGADAQGRPVPRGTQPAKTPKTPKTPQISNDAVGGQWFMMDAVTH
jgi:hypothetical protein